MKKDTRDFMIIAIFIYLCVSIVFDIVDDKSNKRNQYQIIQKLNQLINKE